MPLDIYLVSYQFTLTIINCRFDSCIAARHPTIDMINMAIPSAITKPPASFSPISTVVSCLSTTVL